MNEPRWAFFIGPDKGGSTWFHRWASQHPQVSTPIAKDLYYFTEYWDRGPSWYSSHFEQSAETAINIETCHEYLYSSKAPLRVSATCPSAQYIVVLRNPRERAISAYLYMRRQGRTTLSLDAALDQIPELIDHGLYFKHLKPWVDVLGPAGLRAFNFADLQADPQAFADEVSQALGVEKRLQGRATLSDRARPASAARVQALATAGKRVAVAMRKMGLETQVGRLKESRLVESLLFREIAADQRPRISRRQRTVMNEAVAPDAEKLDQLLGTQYAAEWLD